MFSQQSSNLSQQKHFNELRQLQETKDFIIAESLKKQQKNSLILTQIESISQDMEDLEYLLEKLDKGSEEYKKIEPDLQHLWSDLEKLDSKKKLALESSKNSQIGNLCGEIESLFNSIKSISSNTQGNLTSSPKVLKREQENPLALKHKIDQNKQKIIKNEEDFVKESKDLEILRKDLETLMKMKLDKELEISILLKKEENEQKSHDEQLEKLTCLQKLQTSAQTSEISSKIQKKIEIFPSIPPPPSSSLSPSLFLLFSILLLSIILLI